MKKLFALALLFLLAGVTSALAQDVRYNFDSQANFASFKTYKWVALRTDTPMNDIVDGQIKASVNAELAKKGLTESKTDEADLFIGYQAATDKEKQFTAYNTGWGYGPGWYGAGWYGAGGGMTTGSTSTIVVGQLALDMYSPAPKTLVWRGLVSKTLDAKAKPDKQKKNLDKAVAKLMTNFPPPPPKKK
jgi:hypothetical protein